MNRLLIAYLFLLALCFSSGISGNGGSGYSRYGIGDIQYFSTNRAMGMGGVGIGVLSNTEIDGLNPASWSGLNRSFFSLSTMYEGFSTSDEKKSNYLAGMQFNGLMLAIPLVQKYGLTLGAGITPVSRVNYRILVPITQGGYTYDLDYAGEGGVSQGQLGVSFTPIADFSLGIKMQYYFGTLRHSLTQTFAGTSYTNASVLRSTRISGTGMTLGALYTGLNHLFSLPDNQSLTLGFVVSTTPYLTSADERYYSYTTSFTIRDTLTSPQGTLHFPLAAGGGISFASERFLIAADAYFQQWSAATSNGVADSSLQNSYRFSLGGELIPRRGSNMPFFQRLAYRVGLFYHATYYNIRNQSINEFGLAGGIGIPILGDTRLNIGAQYSFRGTTDMQLLKDKILRISFTLTVGELWFIKPSEE